MKALVGGMSELAFMSTRALRGVLTRIGFTYRHPRRAVGAGGGTQPGLANVGMRVVLVTARHPLFTLWPRPAFIVESAVLRPDAAEAHTAGRHHRRAGAGQPLVPGVDGAYTRFLDGDDQVTTIYEAAMAYRDTATPLLVIAGKDYGSGSSRDWAAKGRALSAFGRYSPNPSNGSAEPTSWAWAFLPLQFLPGDMLTPSDSPGRRPTPSRDWRPPPTDGHPPR